MLSLNEIVCEECQLIKKVRFYKTTKVCRECASSARAKNKAAKRASARKLNKQKHSMLDFINDLWKNYKITYDEYKTLWDSQKGCCGSCGRPESDFKRRLHVDHDHATGQVRGLLCTKCNPGIGMFDDSVEKLEMAITYLNKFKK